MAEPTSEVEAIEKEELENIIKESGIENFLDAMKKKPSKPKKVVEVNDDISWIEEIIRTFQPIHIQLKSHYVVLVKLFDYLTNEGFSGCLFIHIGDNTSTVSMWRGELIGIINNKLDISDEEAFRYILGNYHDASIDIYQPDKEKEALPMILNSIAKEELEPKYKDLDTEFTDLSKLITKMKDQKFTGYIEMKTENGRYIACHHRGEEILTIHLDDNNKYEPSSLENMLGETGIVNIYQGKVRTLVSSMDDAMSKITVLVLNENEEKPTLQKIVDEHKGHIALNVAEAARDNVHLEISLPAGLANRDDCESFKEQVQKTPEFLFARHLFSDYFLDIAETGNTGSLKGIWNNIPRVKVVKFKQKYHEGHVEHAFDLILEDGSGNVLFAARHTDRNPKSYEVEVFLKQLENIREKHNDWQSLKAGFLISTKGFEEDAISAANKETGAGAGVKSVLGKMGSLKVPEMLVASKGFIKTENDGGFYLNLIRQDKDSFDIVFPEL